MSKKIPTPFSKARKFVRSLGLKSTKEWNKYSKSAKRPKHIPSNPVLRYTNEWTSWGDFLGTDRIATRNMQYRSFKEARKFVRSLKLTSNEKWKAYCKSGKKPDDIPKSPDQAYKKEWKNWGDWLGNQNIQPQKRVFRDFVKAKKFVRTLKLKNTTQWKKYCSSGKKPIDIPSAPERIYKKQWKSYSDWLGSKYFATQRMKYRSFIGARTFVRSLGLKIQKEWYDYCKSGDKPNDIPATPNRHYKKEWTTWGEWLGTFRVNTTEQVKNYLPVSEAVKEYHKLQEKYGIKNTADWRRFLKTHKLPANLPTQPARVYSKQRVWERMKK